MYLNLALLWTTRCGEILHYYSYRVDMFIQLVAHKKVHCHLYFRPAHLQKFPLFDRL